MLSSLLHFYERVREQCQKGRKFPPVHDFRPPDLRMTGEKRIIRGLNSAGGLCTEEEHATDGIVLPLLGVCRRQCAVILTVGWWDPSHSPNRQIILCKDCKTFKKLCLESECNIENAILKRAGVSFTSSRMSCALRYIYVIYRAGGPYGKKLCPRSGVRPEAEGQGPYSIPRVQFFFLQNGPT